MEPARTVSGGVIAPSSALSSVDLPHPDSDVERDLVHRLHRPLLAERVDDVVRGEVGGLGDQAHAAAARPASARARVLGSRYWPRLVDSW